MFRMICMSNIHLFQLPSCKNSKMRQNTHGLDRENYEFLMIRITFLLEIEIPMADYIEANEVKYHKLPGAIASSTHHLLQRTM